MNCLTPVNAWFCGVKPSKDGIISPRLVFSAKEALDYYVNLYGTGLGKVMFMQHETFIDCGKCFACQCRKRKEMTVRLAHEISMYEECSFITLTYDDEHIPVTNGEEWSPSCCKGQETKDEYYERRKEGRLILERGSKEGIATLLPSDVQKFMKRLRRHLEYVPKHKKDCRDHVGKLRYFCVGEYGTKTKRPHYHLIIFGWKPSDLKLWKLEHVGTKREYCVFRSAQVEKLWKYGFSTVAPVNFAVAKYCARYVTKKFTRLQEESTFEDSCRCPEFILASKRNGGIGSAWLARYFENLKNGFVTVRTGEDRITKYSVPRYYYSRLRKINLPLWEDLRNERLLFVKCKGLKSKNYADLCRWCDSQRYNIKQEKESEKV